MKVTLKDYTKDAEEKIASYSAICYDADTGVDANARRIKHLLRLGHLATLRFAYATFLVEGVSRNMTHQMVRHPHLSYLQESQRYVNQGSAGVVIPDSLVAEEALKNMVGNLVTHSKNVYDSLILAGVRKEDARYMLLSASTSRMYITGNFQAWREALTLRMDKSAQWEIREVALEMWKQLHNVAPNVFTIDSLNEF